MSSRLPVIICTVMGFVAGAIAAEGRHRDCVMVHYSPRYQGEPILGCVALDGELHCFEHEEFDATLQDLQAPASTRDET